MQSRVQRRLAHGGGPRALRDRGDNFAVLASLS